MLNVQQNSFIGLDTTPPWVRRPRARHMNLDISNPLSSPDDQLWVYTPLSTPIASLNLHITPPLAAFDIKVDRKLKFPVLLLAIATVYRTIANARLRSELTKGCMGLHIT